MDKKKMAREIVELAKAIVSNKSLLDDIVSQKDLLTVEDNVDEQTWDLAVKVYRTLQDQLKLTNDQSEAINRLKLSIKNARSYTSDVHRNNIFKAAHALGIKLPTSQF